MGFWSRRKKESNVDGEVGGPEGGPGPALALPSEERYCRTDLIKLQVGADAQLVYSRIDRSTHLLPTAVGRLLDQCQSFRTIEEQVSACTRFARPDQGQAEALRRQLLQLIESRLLLSESELLKLCDVTLGRVEAADAISSISILTHNRPQSLLRCLNSYLENSRRFGRTTGITISDSSDDDEDRARTRLLVEQQQKQYGVKIRYGGAEEKIRFAKLLIDDCQLPPDAVEFALFDSERCGYAPGVNRNSLLLDGVGDLLLSVDDDTVCRFARSPEETAGLVLMPSGGFVNQWLFPNRETALSSASTLDEDIQSVHEQVLGKTLKACVVGFAGREGLRFGQVSSRFLDDLTTGQGRVLATLTGIAGDSGTDVPAVYQMLNEDSLARALQSEAHYRTAGHRRDVLRVVNSLSITNNPSCMTTAIGLDNRDILPPFMPVLRGQDDIFGITLKSCFADGYFAHLPRAVFHDPPESRHSSRESVRDLLSKVRTCSVLVACINSFPATPERAGAEERLRSLGKHLTNVGALPRREFEEFIRIQLWRMESAYLNMFEGYLKSHAGSPRFWQDEMDEYLKSLRAALAKDDYIVPQDLPVNGDADARDLLRRLVYKFGRLLETWPDMVSAARELRAKELRLAL
jgi:hypothetical protein